VSRNPTFTQAEVRRAVKAAESAGLRVRRVTIGRDGSIVVDSGDERFVPVDAPKTSLAGSWDDL
jgi:sugar/nucleoside kinase (ribokinase family)